MTEQPLTERYRRIAFALEDLVQEGEELYITRFEEEGVVVSDKPSGDLERNHPRLYGRLLSLDAQLEGGNLVNFLGLALIVLLWLGVQARWWEQAISEELVERLNVWWLYVLLVLLVLFLSGMAQEARAKQIYRRCRPELLPLLEDANFDRDLLLVRIKEDDQLTNITHQLKLDPFPFPRPHD